MADRIPSNGCSHWRNLYPDDHHAHVLARGRSRHGIQRQVHPYYRNLSFDPCLMSDKLAQKDCLFYIIKYLLNN